jgi:carbonic anhydrase
MDADKALGLLKEGNERFAADAMTHPNLSEERRGEVVTGQQPFAVVLTCSDSRTPPEIIFDRGIGDLFVVRTAGNVTGEVSIGSIELAVEEFGVELVMVLGHQNCGAVKLAIAQGDASGHIETIVNRIRPAVLLAQSQPGDLLENAAKANVKLTVDHMKSLGPILSRTVDEGKLKIVGGYYRLDSGQVEMVVE